MWTVPGVAFPLPPEPHNVVFWSCTWGVNMARLVWQFLTTLVWPPCTAQPGRGDGGISWVELEFFHVVVWRHSTSQSSNRTWVESPSYP